LPLEPSATGQRWARPTFRRASHPKPEIAKGNRTVPTTNIARQISDVNAQIADTEIRIIQQQKRVENLRAKGADVTEMQSAVDALAEMLADLETHKAELEQQLG
jgi:TolA-binding protein